MTSSDQVDHLRGIFVANRDRLCLADAIGERELTYGEVARRSLAIAQHFASRDVGAGDSVAFLASNSLELALIYFACWHRGARIVPIYKDLPDDQIAHILRSCSPKLFVIDAGQADRTVASAWPERLVFAPVGRDAHDDASDIWSLPTSDQDDAALFAGLHDASPIMRIYTSGSTAAPKGVEILAGRILGNERLFCDTLGIGSDNRFYNILPMAYLGGIHNLLLLPLANGGSVVIGEPLGPSNVFGFWETVDRYGINTLWFSPTMLAMLLQIRHEDGLEAITSRIVIALVGMAALPQQLKKDFEARFGFRLLENYAMSEIAFVSTHLPGVESDPRSKGFIMPDIGVAVLDSDHRELPQGETGELRVDTPYLMAGYIDASDADLANITGRGFLTGDIGYISGGELYLVDRKKDLIIRGGLNIAPAMIEDAISKNPYVAETAVVGVPHAAYGEEVAAAVVLATDAPAGYSPKDLIASLADRLSQFQRPKQVILLDALPKGVTGKVDKKAVRRLFEGRPAGR